MNDDNQLKFAIFAGYFKSVLAAHSVSAIFYGEVSDSCISNIGFEPFQAKILAFLRQICDLKISVGKGDFVADKLHNISWDNIPPHYFDSIKVDVI